eukprot:1140333-Pelagomonas_calceolata.AAC.2
MAGAECSLFTPRPPLLLNGYWELVLDTLLIKTTNIASGQLKVSLCLSGKWRGKTYLGRVLFVECSGIRRTICATNVHGGKACSKGDFADTFKEEGEFC